MKGVIFNLVEDAVTASHGEAMWDALLERAGLSGSWTAIGDYPDEQLLLLVEHGSAMLGVEAAELTRRLGHDALLGLAGRYPRFFETHTDTTSFLFTLNDVIHPEVRKLHPAAQPPWFDFEQAPDGTLLVAYHSQRALCALADGMMRGAATWFGETATITHEACTRDGAAHCRLRCTFTPAHPAGTSAPGQRREMSPG